MGTSGDRRCIRSCASGGSSFTRCLGGPAEAGAQRGGISRCAVASSCHARFWKADALRGIGGKIASATERMRASLSHERRARMPKYLRGVRRVAGASWATALGCPWPPPRVHARRPRQVRQRAARVGHRIRQGLMQETGLPTGAAILFRRNATPGRPLRRGVWV